MAGDNEEFVLYLTTEPEDIFFSDSCDGSEKGTEPVGCIEIEEHTNLNPTLGNEVMRQWEQHHMVCCVEDESFPVATASASMDPCLSGITPEVQERDRARWGFPQLRKIEEREVEERNVCAEVVDVVLQEEDNMYQEQHVQGPIVLSSGRVLGVPIPKHTRDMQRELDRIRTLASRLRQEGDKLDKWLANMNKMLAVQQEKVRRSKRFEEEKNKRRTDKLLRQIQDLKRMAGIPDQIVRYSRIDLENM